MSWETQIWLKKGSESITKADLAPSQGVASSIPDYFEVQPAPEDLTGACAE